MLRASRWVSVAASASLLSLQACSSSTLVVGSDPGVGNDAGEPVAAAPPAGEDAGPSAAKDAGAPAATSWTREQGNVFLATGARAVGLVADPATPRRLLVYLDGNALSPPPASLAVTWSSGVVGPALSPWNVDGTKPQITGRGAGGFAGGNVYDFVVVSPFASAHVAVSGQSAWHWEDVPQKGSTWPVRSVVVVPGLPAKAYAKTDETLIELTDPSQPVTAIGMRGRVYFTPDRPKLLLVGEDNGLYRGLLGGASFVPVGAGLNVADPIEGLWIHPTNARRVALWSRASGSGAKRLHASSDGGETFTSVPLPRADVLQAELTFSPADERTMAVLLPATSTLPQSLHVTKDLGATWSATALPPGTREVRGIAFDAAGVLFALRDDTPFSTAP